MSKSSNEIKYEKLLIFGDKGCGKTSLVKKMEKGIFEDEYIQDKEVNQVGNHIKVKGKSLYLNTIEYRTNENENEECCLLKSCLYACKCAVFMIDATSEDSLSSIKDFLEKINKEEYPNLSFIFLLSKIDEEKVILFEEVKALSDKINKENSPERAVALEISLKNEKNYKQLINTISNSVSRNLGFSIDNISDFIKRPLKLKDYNLIKILIFGDCVVGKTAFILKYFKNYFIDTNINATTGIYDCKKIMKVNDKIFKITVRDTEGPKKYRPLRRCYYRNVNGVIILYDVTSERTFKGVRDWVNEIKKNGGEEAIIYIAGNKIDLPNRKVSTEDGENFAKTIGAKYYEISLKINLNVNEIMLDLILECAKVPKKIEEINLSERNKKHSCVIF